MDKDLYFESGIHIYQINKHLNKKGKKKKKTHTHDLDKLSVNKIAQSIDPAI